MGGNRFHGAELLNVAILLVAVNFNFSKRVFEFGEFIFIKNNISRASVVKTFEED